MKFQNKVFFFTLGLISMLFFSFVIPENQNNSEIINAIKLGNARELSKHFNSSIDLILPGNEGTYSKTQAELMVGSFFRSNPPKSFVVRQEGTSSDSSKYTIGQYSSTNNKSFRTYFLTKRIGSSQLIQLLQFEEN
jgi:hypothetical protein